MPSLRISNSGKGKTEGRGKESPRKIARLLILSIIFIWLTENYSAFSLLQEITLDSVYFLLQSSGIEIERQGLFIIAGDLVTLISPECSGLFGIFILFSFILLSNKSWVSKLKGSLALIPIAFLTNILWDFLYLAILFLLCLLFHKIF